MKCLGCSIPVPKKWVGAPQFCDQCWIAIPQREKLRWYKMANDRDVEIANRYLRQSLTGA